MTCNRDIWQEKTCIKGTSTSKTYCKDIWQDKRHVSRILNKENDTQHEYLTRKKTWDKNTWQEKIHDAKILSQVKYVARIFHIKRHVARILDKEKYVAQILTGKKTCSENSWQGKCKWPNCPTNRIDKVSNKQERKRRGLQTIILSKQTI